MADHDVLIREIQQLRKLRARWRAVAIAALALVFVVMIPLTFLLHEALEYLLTHP